MKNLIDRPRILSALDQGAIFSATLYTFHPDSQPQYHTSSRCHSKNK
jgi:hypothetical protein